MTEPVRLQPPGAGTRPLPRRIMHPSGYGLALAVTALIRDYGRSGAVNMLVEFAELVRNGDDVLKHTLRHDRVELR